MSSISAKISVFVPKINSRNHEAQPALNLADKEGGFCLTQTQVEEGNYSYYLPLTRGEWAFLTAPAVARGGLTLYAYVRSLDLTCRHSLQYLPPLLVFSEASPTT